MLLITLFKYALTRYADFASGPCPLSCLSFLFTLKFVSLHLCRGDFPVPFRHGERIGFSYLISQKYTGDNAAVKVLRNSEMLNFNIKLASHKRLIPAHNRGRPPSYYIIAGFVFTTVSVPYLRSEVCNSLSISLLVFPIR